MLSIGTNTGDIMAQAAASSVTRDMETAMHRLSTGKRINAAADDAAGVAISSRLDSTVRGLNQSIRNALDAQALIDTAEGGMQETETILQRIRELSIQASNDTNSADDRANLNAEAQSLLSEIDRISNSTTWAGQSLLDGTFADKSFQVGTGTMAADQLVTSIAGVSASELGLGGSTTQSVSNGQTVTSSTFNSINITGPTTIANSSSSKNGINHFSAEPNGDGFLLSWTTVPHGGGGGGIYLQKTDSAGIAVGSPIAIDTDGNVNHTHSVQLDNGNTAFTYMKYSGGRYNTKVLLLDADLNILSNTTANSGEPTGDYHNGRIENLGNSKFIVKWDYNPNHPQLDARGSKAQIFNYDGTKNGSSFAVSSSNATYAAPEITAFNDTHLAALVANSTGGDKQIHLEVYDLGDKSNLNSVLISDGGDDDTIGSYQVKTTPAGFSVSWTEGSADEGYVRFFDKTGVATTSKIKIGENITMISEIVTKTEADGSVVSEVFWGSTDSGSAVTNYSRLTNYDASSLVSKGNVINGYNGVMIPGTASNGNYMLFNNESYDDPVRAFNVDVTMDHSLSLDILSTDNAQSAITLVDAALQSLNSQRASLGAISNRLDHNIANNTNAANNVAKSLGRIQDADFAAESTSLAKNQILLQASTAMLAQANASKQNILDLLQN